MMNVISGVPEFILMCIEVGKQLNMIYLLQDAHEAVSYDKCYFFSKTIDIMMSHDPEEVNWIGRAFGHQKACLDDPETCGQDFLRFLTLILPLISGLKNSCYFPSSRGSNMIGLDVHQGSIESLGDALKHINWRNDGVDLRDLVNKTLNLTRDGKEKNCLGAFILVNRIMAANQSSSFRFAMDVQLPQGILHSSLLSFSHDRILPGSDGLEEELGKIFKK